MKLESVLEKDKRWSVVVSTAAPVATGPASAAFFVSNRTAKRTTIRTRDNAWRIGDQAMNKYAFVTTNAITRGSFQ